MSDINNLIEKNPDHVQVKNLSYYIKRVIDYGINIFHPTEEEKMAINTESDFERVGKKIKEKLSSNNTYNTSNIDNIFKKQNITTENINTDDFNKLVKE